MGNVQVSGSSGYRVEGEVADPVKSMIHVEGDLLWALDGGYALHLTSQNEFRTLAGNTYERGSSFIGVDKTRLGGVTVEIGFDTQDPREEVRNIFVAGLLAWHISSALDLRATIGNQRGGIKCVSGICRDTPAFAGIKTEFVGRF